MKRILPLLSIAALYGCGPGVTNPMPDIPETVEYDTVRIEYGEDDLVDGTPATAEAQMLVGDPSLVAGVSQGLIRGTNRVIFQQLRLVDSIVQTRPTEVRDGQWAWDNAASKPDSEPFSRFEITEIDEESYAYEWTLGTRADEMLVVFSAEFRRRERVDGRQRGSGILRFNFDNIHEVDADADAPRGRAAIAFRAVGGVRQVHVATFDLVELGRVDVQNARFEYVELRSGAGRFKFGQAVDFLRDGEPLETLSIDAVWTPGQRGRAMASLTGGSLEINEVLLHECWDRGGMVSFADATPDLPVEYEDGEESACADVLTEFSLDPPEFSPPQTDPEIPGTHPDEQ